MIKMFAAFMSLDMTSIGQIESGTMDEIPVDDLVVVDEEEALTHLLHNLLDLTETELHVDVAEQTSQVVLAEVEHKKECGLVPAVLPANLDEVDDVLMVEQLEDPDLPESSDRKAFLLIFHQNFLQSHNLTAVFSTLGLEKRTYFPQEAALSLSP